MKNSGYNKLGLLEQTLREFKKNGISSLDVIRNFLIEKYKITVSNGLLKKRLTKLKD